MSERKNQQRKREHGEGNTHQGTYLFQGFMFWLLPILLGLSIWFRLIPLIVLTTCLLVTACLIILWKKHALKHLQPGIKLSTNRVFAGQAFKLTMSVSNHKWWPLVWLEWEQTEQQGITWQEQKQGRYMIRLLWLLWYQGIEWQVEGQAAQRGVYELGRFTLRSGDGFRFTEEEADYHLPATLYVYPKLKAVTVPNRRATMAWEMMGTSGGFLEDPLLIDGLREYQSGDEWRRIDWPASSRTGVLQTRLYTKIKTEHIHLVIDVQGFELPEEPEPHEQPHHQQSEQKQASKQINEQFEEFLSIIASVAVSYREQKVWVGLSSNALDYRGKRLATIAPGAELTPCLDQLAKLSVFPAVGSARLLQELLLSKGKNMPIFYFCFRLDDSHLAFWKAHNQELPYLRFYYVEESDQAGKMGGIARPIAQLVTESC